MQITKLLMTMAGGSASTSTTKKICIAGGGNAAHALAALLPYKGYETSMYCPFRKVRVSLP